MAGNTLIRDMTTGHPMKQLVGFSLPFMLSNLLQQAYSLADMMIVGQLVGSAGLAAASTGGEIIFLFFFICMGFTSSGQIIVSQHIGKGNRERIGKTVGTLFSFVLCLAVVMTVVCIACCERLVGLMNTPAEAYEMARVYVITSACGNISVFGYNAIAAVLRGMGDSKHPTVFVAISASSNVVLDLIFVGPLKMGVFGAALATILAQTAAFIASVVFIVRRREDFGFDFKPTSFRPDPVELKTLVKLGIPIAIQSVAVNVSMLFVTSCINSYGLVASAVTAVGNKISLAATICTSALNTAGATIVAQCFAARKFKRVSLTVLNCLLIGMGFCAVLTLLVVTLPEQLFGLFDRDPEVLAMSHSYAAVAAISLAGFAERAAVFAFINGIGFSRLALVGGLLDGIAARIGLSLLFGNVLGMGVYGFWLGNALAGHTFSIIGLVYYFFGKWRERKPIVS